MDDCQSFGRNMSRRGRPALGAFGLCLTAIFFFLIIQICPVSATAQVARIMPLGNSITDGYWYSTDQGGYRRPLYLSLQAAGIQVDFVGSLVRGVPTDFDWDHEGHAGWRADQLRDNIYTWLTLNPADFVLLHIGTNDVSQVTEDPVEVAQLLDEIDRFEQDFANPITVLVARIILRNDSRNPETIAFNDSVEAIVAQRILAGDDLLTVNIETALSYPADLADAVHPNDAGYLNMAQAWFEALAPLLDASSAWVTDAEINGSAYSAGDDDDLVCTYTINGAARTAATCWQLNGQSIMDLYLPFESDSSGYTDFSTAEHSVVSGGGVALDSLAGHDGFGAAVFDGSDSATVVVTGIDLSGAYTKCGWVKPASLAEVPIMTGQFDHWFGAAPGESGFASAGHGGIPYVQDLSPLAVGVWQFLAVTFDPTKAGGTLTLYRNGAEIVSAIGVPPVSASDTVLFLGSYAGQQLSGVLDDARIYKRALTAEQISSLYIAGRDVLVAEETVQGEVWTAQVTPFSAASSGPGATSNAVAIAFGSVTNLQLVSSAGGNTSDEDLILQYALPPGAMNAASAWYVNGVPFQEVYLPMDGGSAAAVDFSGHQVQVIPSAGLQWHSAGGLSGTGAYLFGVNGHMSLGETLPIGGSYTKSCWVKRTGEGVSNGGNIISGDNGHVFWAPATHAHHLAAGHSNPWNAVIDAVPLALDTWYQIAVTYDVVSQTMILYKNGTEVSRAGGIPPNSTDATLFIGAYSAGYQWEGYIDDVLIYSRALDSLQIVSLYETGTAEISYTETAAGEEWYAVVTPFASLAAGSEAVSNSLTVGGIVLSAPSLLAPMAGVQGVQFDMKPTFSWTASAPPGSGVMYRLRVATDETFTFRLEQDSLSDTTFVWPDSLDFGDQYWWQVEAYTESGGSGVSSPVETFWTWELGDMNHSHQTNLTDLTMLVNRLFLGGAAIEPEFVADVSGDCAVTLTDLTRLVNNLFLGGGPLVVGCE